MVGSAQRDGSPPAGRAAAAWIAGLAAVLVLLLVWLAPGIRQPGIVLPGEDAKPALPKDTTAFFSARNSVRFEVPYAMSVDELIALYRLEDGRADILSQVDAKDGRARLEQGRTITVTLTPALQPLRPRGAR
jgi:hypothetical protein